MSLQEGIYKGRGVAGSEQYGKTKNGNDQIVLNLELEGAGEVSTFLVFTDAAAPYSIRRLRALGWQGGDLTNLAGIDANEVDVEVKYEEYNGELKMKVQIMTGGSFTLENELDDKGKKAFAARFKHLTGGAAAPTGGPRPAAARPQQRPPARAPQRSAAPTQTQQATGTDDYGGGNADDDIPF